MVNTFLPYSDFKRSAEVLDYKRLGKQRVEAWQILSALRGQTKGWVNHPATKMWRGHERSLCEYGIAICDEWINRGYKDSMRERFIAIYSELPTCENPIWLGDNLVHEGYQSNLMAKNPTHYKFRVMKDIPYYWYDKSEYGTDNKLYVSYQVGNHKTFRETVVNYKEREPLPEHIVKFKEYQINEYIKKIESQQKESKTN